MFNNGIYWIVFKISLFNYAKSKTKTSLKKMGRVKKAYETLGKNNTICAKIKSVEKRNKYIIFVLIVDKN